MNFVYGVRRSSLMRSEPKEVVKRSLLIQIASLCRFETSRRPKWLRTPKRLPGSPRIGLRRPVELLWLYRARIWRPLCMYSAPSTWRASSIRDRIATMSIDFPYSEASHSPGVPLPGCLAYAWQSWAKADEPSSLSSPYSTNAKVSTRGRVFPTIF